MTIEMPKPATSTKKILYGLIAFVLMLAAMWVYGYLDPSFRSHSEPENGFGLKQY